MKFVEKVTKALIKQQNFSNYYNKTDKIRSNLTDRNTQSKVQLEKVKIRPQLQH